MLQSNERASLTAGLLETRRTAVIDRLLAGRSPEPAAAPPAEALFRVKPASVAMPARRAERGPPASSIAPPATRLTVRLSPDQRWRLRLAATYFRQTCQTFLVEAIDRHIARLVRDPAHRGFGALITGGAPAVNG